MRCCKTRHSRRERGISPKTCAASSAKTSRSTILKRHSLNLRVLVRELLKAGDTDQQIEDFIVARYGEFVLLKPRLAPTPWCCGLPPRGLPHRTPDHHFGRSGAATPTALSDAEERRHFDLDGRNPSLAHGRIGARTCRF